MVESYSMTGGDGTYSYSKNSSLQREAIRTTKSLIDEAISEKLEITPNSNIFRIADLGCSVGPNAFLCVENIIKAVKLKYPDPEIPEIQVFFNDHTANDFNTLFQSLPLEKPYFAAGVPGSFHVRLFPENSIHFFHSSGALQWLSHVPNELLDTNSPAWNKGRIFYLGAPKPVIRAYADQFAKDVEIFLNVRAKELVEGGIMVLLLPAAVYNYTTETFNILGSCLMDMAKEGTVKENVVDSFNLPIYAPTEKEMLEHIERNGCFKIEKIELFNAAVSKVDYNINIKGLVLQLRAIVEGLVTKHFGNEIIDELFDRVLSKAEQLFPQLQQTKPVEEKQFMFLALKRNSSHL